MKKPLLIGFLLVLSLIPVLSSATLVTCNGPDCTIGKFFETLVEIYKFIVFQIATPLAVIALIIGGIFMMISAGNPNTFATGRKIMISAIIGLALAFCSYLIISFVLDTLGFTGNWQHPVQ